jgi:hypothetical protein
VPTEPTILGAPTANWALVVSITALLVSGLSAGVAIWVARRDRADVRVRMRYADYYHPSGKKAGPFLSIEAANRGRRPVRLSTYGFAYSDKSTGVCMPYPVTPLPRILEEGESYTGFIALRAVQENVRARKARLSAVYFDAADSRRFKLPIHRWSRWRKELRDGELAPPPGNEDLLGQFGNVPTLGQKPQTLGGFL